MRDDRAWRMTLGAQPEADGMRFRVWAPTARSVDVIVYGPSAERIEPLEPEGEGYFAGRVGEIGAGARYRYRLDGEATYPDPASRSQPEGVHGPSEVVDPDSYAWSEDAWEGREHEELVIYELHVGTFSPEGTFAGVVSRLDDLVELGVTAIEIMPVANFAGERNWGYDGVNLFAPATAYGRADELKRLVDEAHRRGLAVLLDVVYNHLGPEGNYIPAVTGGRFFTDRHHTPWGDAINFDGPGSHAVRDFVIQNALHWIHEYRVDGLRLDATHALVDDSPKHILAELAERVHAAPGPRRVLIAEDERNDRRLLLPSAEGGYGLDAIWADDLHHQVRRLVAGDSEGYFAHYHGTTADLAATLRQGWWRTGDHPVPEEVEEEPREGTSPEGIPPKRFVHCIQNHDQVGNRAFGERLNHQIPLTVYRALSTLLLTSPYTPMLWMGQEWAASSPFHYFTDHPEELGRLVTEGRRREFGRFSAFRDPEVREQIPNPQSPTTFERSRLDWSEREDGEHEGVLALYQALLELRRSHPALRNGGRDGFDAAPLGDGTLVLRRNDPAGGALLVVVCVAGEIVTQLDRAPITRPPGDAPWRPVLATEERRFGGDGGWGRLEADGSLHLSQPGAVVLEG
jgi:maltooligosyltrehalose trehalohydrolase